MTNWTPDLIEERFAEAAVVLEQLPRQRRQAYFKNWPEDLYALSSLIGQQQFPRRSPPSAAAISRMEETLAWTFDLDPIDGRIIWMKAYGLRWKVICKTVALQRSAANDHRLYGLSIIVLKLNRRRFKRSLSKRKVIELASASQA